ncbi:MAG: hypothetical protein ACFFDN_22185 [Candidatus Hodarchaeota archaeon]
MVISDVPISLSLEEVGFYLLLLPIFLFQDFTIFPNRILFYSKTGFQQEIYQHLLSSLNMITGHQFYIKCNEEHHLIELFCLDNPQIFQRFTQE